MENETTINASKYALITGATSGIGYELAKQVAMDGYNLILVARDEQQLAQVAEELGLYGREVKTIAKDLFSINAAHEVYEEVRNMGVSIDILINDAGQGQYGLFAEVELERHMEIIQLNIISLVALTHCFLQDMLAREQGKILQLGSEVSKVPMPLMSVYAATKSFVLSFTEGLINELKDTGVSMTLLMPGATDTDFFDRAEMEDTKVYREAEMDSPEEVAKLAFQALKNGDRRIIGPSGRINVALAALIPDHILANKQREQMEPAEDEEGRKEPSHQRSLENKHKKEVSV